MRGLNSAVSVTVHVAVGAAVLVGTTRTVRSDPVRPDSAIWLIAPETPANRGGAIGGSPLPGPITVAPPDINSISRLSTIPDGVVPKQGLSAVFAPFAASGSDPAGGWSGALGEEPAEVLSGPLPVYPDLLCQAGVQGRVVLEATVDTTGRVLRASIQVVSATNPGFVAPARHALLATLFRPAMVGGHAVRMRVRIPYEFAIQTGAERAR